MDSPAIATHFDGRQQTLVGSIGAAVNSITEVLALLEEQVSAPGEVLEVAEQLGILVTRAQAAHTLAVGQARMSGMWAVRGYATNTSWLRDTHRLDGGRARALERNASWLAEHPQTQQAFVGGRITIEHVNALRRITAASARRNELYPEFEVDLLDVASNADPARTIAVLKAWADAVDTQSADDESTSDHQKRSLHLTQVGNGWDLRGWLPAALGASLAGVLNEVMEQRRRDSSDNALDPPATRRADALMDLAAAAHSATQREGSGSFMGPGARSRAKIVVTVPLFRLFSDHPNNGGAEHWSPSRRGDPPQEHWTPSRRGDPPREHWTPSRRGDPPRGKAGHPTSPPQEPRRSAAPRQQPPPQQSWLGEPPLQKNPPDEPPHQESPPGELRSQESPPHKSPPPSDAAADAELRVGTPQRDAGEPNAHPPSPGTHDNPVSVPLSSVDPREFASWWYCGNGAGQGFLAMSEVRRLACDAEVQRLVVGPDSRPLDIGRATRVVPEHLRTALTHRDQGCIMPGCDRPPGWCEAHHIVHWANGGRTDLENLMT